MSRTSLELLLEVGQPLGGLERDLLGALLGFDERLSRALFGFGRQLIGALLAVERELPSGALGVADHTFGALVRPLLERLQGVQQGLSASSEAALVVLLEHVHARSVGTGRVQCQASAYLRQDDFTAWAAADRGWG